MSLWMDLRPGWATTLTADNCSAFVYQNPIPTPSYLYSEMASQAVFYWINMIRNRSCAIFIRDQNSNNNKRDKNSKKLQLFRFSTLGRSQNFLKDDGFFIIHWIKKHKIWLVTFQLYIPSHFRASKALGKNHLSRIWQLADCTSQIRVPWVK